MAESNYAVALECHHVNNFRKPTPKVGEVVWCRKCGDYSEVIAAEDTPFRLKCRNCSFGSTYGADGTTAGRRAAAHVIRKGSHTIDVFHGDKKVRTIVGSQDVLSEDILGVNLTDIAKQNASLLRKFTAGRTNAGNSDI